MMDKLLITKEQKEALDNWNHFGNSFEYFLRGGGRASDMKPLYDFTPEQFALLLCGWYKVEQPFKVGDWIVQSDTESNKVFEVESISESGRSLSACCSKGSCILAHKNNWRHATAEEIAQEKERRKWAEVGREVNEYKTADIVAHPSVKQLLEFVSHSPGNNRISHVTKDFADSELEVITQDLKLVTPVEQRLDLEEHQ